VHLNMARAHIYDALGAACEPALAAGNVPQALGLVAKSFNWPESAFRQISFLQPTASRGRATLPPTGSTCAFLSLGPAPVFSPWRRSQPHAALRSGR